MYLKHQTIKQQTVFINSFVSTNYHTKPRTNNSAEEATTGNTSVIYGMAIHRQPKLTLRGKGVM